MRTAQIGPDLRLVCYAFDLFSVRFKKPDERQVLHRIMQVLLPQLYSRFTMIIEDGSQPSVEIQKQILKIFFALIQVSGCLKTDLHVYCKLLLVSPPVAHVDPSTCKQKIHQIIASSPPPPYPWIKPL